MKLSMSRGLSLGSFGAWANALALILLVGGTAHALADEHEVPEAAAPDAPGPGADGSPTAPSAPHFDFAE